jgi:hypothetical protein
MRADAVPVPVRLYWRAPQRIVSVASVRHMFRLREAGMSFERVAAVYGFDGGAGQARQMTWLLSLGGLLDHMRAVVVAAVTS